MPERIRPKLQCVPGEAAWSFPQRTSDRGEAKVLPVNLFWPVAPSLDGGSHGTAKTCVIRVVDEDNRPISGAEVRLSGHPVSGSDEAITDRAGSAVLQVDHDLGRVHASLTIEAEGYWGLTTAAPRMCPYDPKAPVTNVVTLSAISGPALDSTSWGHELMRLDQVPHITTLGSRQVRLGVISVGLAARPHVYHGFGQPGGGVAGKSGNTRKPVARDIDRCHSLLAEMCPDASLFGVELPLGATASDLVQAIDTCVGEGVDILMLCVELTGEDASVKKAVDAAHALGVVIIAPAGDAEGPVVFPARFETVLGVAALGMKRSAPKTCPHLCVAARSVSGDVFTPVGAAQGDGINLLAPGLAVVAGNAVVSGSVLAAAHVAGFAACLLQTNKALISGKRGSDQAQMLHSMIRTACVNLGLPPKEQGWGMPVWGDASRVKRATKNDTHRAEAAQRASAILFGDAGR